MRHILIKTQGKPKEEAPKLKAKAEDLLKQLQHGADFAGSGEEELGRSGFRGKRRRSWLDRSRTNRAQF